MNAHNFISLSSVSTILTWKRKKCAHTVLQTTRYVLAVFPSRLVFLIQHLLCVFVFTQLPCSWFTALFHCTNREDVNYTLHRIWHKGSISEEEILQRAGQATFRPDLVTNSTPEVPRNLRQSLCFKKGKITCFEWDSILEDLWWLWFNSFAMSIIWLSNILHMYIIYVSENMQSLWKNNNNNNKNTEKNFSCHIWEIRAITFWSN